MGNALGVCVQKSCHHLSQKQSFLLQNPKKMFEKRIETKGESQNNHNENKMLSEWVTMLPKEWITTQWVLKPYTNVTRGVNNTQRGVNDYNEQINA